MIHGPHSRHPDISWRKLQEELRRELGLRQQLYPGRVQSARMSRAEAEREIALCRAWAEDVQRMIDRSRMPHPRPPLLDCPPQHGFTWRNRQEALLREIAMRERLYPEWIRAARLSREQAHHRLACLHCLLDIYEDGWDWCGSDGMLPSRSKTAAEEFAAMRGFAEARNGLSQQELAL